MSNNNQTNSLIRWTVVAFDFVLLNSILAAFSILHPQMANWQPYRLHVFWMVSNLSLVLSETRFSTIIHRRLISAGDVLRRIVDMSIMQMVLAYLIMKVIDLHYPVGRLLVPIGVVMFVTLLVVRLLERQAVKHYRLMGRNTRMVTLVGSDSELLRVYERLLNDPTTGYRVTGRYGQENDWEVPHSGTLADLMDNLATPERLKLGDEMYVCLSRRDRETVFRLSTFCDQQMIRFFYIPVSLETLGITLRSEFLDDIEIYTTYENPLANPLNKLVKRAFDIVVSALALLMLLPFLPVIAAIIKTQSPGPIFFKQLRTGLDGKNFYCYKFRSMHVNTDADRVQATKDDPRKYAFGNFMRKYNIDELPQFWNVLKGDMSIVGPRPHMLAHTEMYSQLIAKYMVRHFVKPGVTGWAQVTGFRGETHELWQMEGRVKRDIWYMENWSFWLDIRIIWMTAKSLVIHDENAY